MARRTRKPTQKLAPTATKDLKIKSAVVRQLRDTITQDTGDDRISHGELEFSIGFLKYFGYLKNGLETLTMKDFLAGVKAFQKFVGIDATGTLDQKTANVMQAPRCGVADHNALQLQMALTGETMPANRQPKWNKPAITWCMTDFVSGIPQDVQKDIVNTAYNQLAEVCGLKISGTSNRDSADIIIGVGQGPRNQFDGPGNTLAWAYLPPGDDRQLLLLFDMDENWAAKVTGSPREVLMLNVATHEGGHTLGLSHSQMPQALMAPYYSPTVSKPVSPDDIEKLVALYGRPTATVPPTTGGPVGSLPAEMSVSVWSGGTNGVVYKGTVRRS